MMTDSNIPTTAAKPSARAAQTPAATPTPTQSIPAKTASKSDTVIRMLLRAKGATPTELIAATDWQAHSLRAFLSGLRKKGRAVVREERKGGGFAYRIVSAPAPAEATGGGVHKGKPPEGTSTDPTESAGEGGAGGAASQAAANGEVA